MTTTGPFFFFESLLPPLPRPNAPALVVDDGDGDADRCGRRRSAARPADLAVTSVRREQTITDALVEAARQLEEGRALEARLDDRRRRGEAVVGNVVAGVGVVIRAAEAAVDPHADADVDAQQPPARLEAIEDADMEAQETSERAKRDRSPLSERRRKKRK